MPPCVVSCSHLFSTFLYSVKLIGAPASFWIPKSPEVGSFGSGHELTARIWSKTAASTEVLYPGWRDSGIKMLQLWKLQQYTYLYYTNTYLNWGSKLSILRLGKAPEEGQSECQCISPIPTSDYAICFN
jgi:hypothetical protein